MKSNPISLVSTCRTIAAVSMLSTLVWASPQDLSTGDEVALNPRTNPGHLLIHHESINNILDSYTLKEIFSYPGVARQASGVCHLWEKLLTNHGTTAIIYFKNTSDLLSYPLSPYPKSRFKMFCDLFKRSYDLSNQDLMHFVQRVPMIQYLDLSRNKSITDVSALGGVHTLDLQGTKVTDVSALGGVHTLNLMATKVSDVSALGGVHTLNLSHTEVINIEALGHLHTLDLGYTQVTDVSALDRVSHLTLPSGQKLIRK